MFSQGIFFQKNKNLKNKKIIPPHLVGGARDSPPQVNTCFLPFILKDTGSQDHNIRVSIVVNPPIPQVL